jgi:hypothetical protein
MTLYDQIVSQAKLYIQYSDLRTPPPYYVDCKLPMKMYTDLQNEIVEKAGNMSQILSMPGLPENAKFTSLYTEGMYINILPNYLEYGFTISKKEPLFESNPDNPTGGAKVVQMFQDVRA